MLNEELLAIWLRLSRTIDNHRLAELLTCSLPFNEMVVCGLLESGRCHTASELCAETRILKSQMNAILSSLERKGVLVRQRSETDRRRVELQLLRRGRSLYGQAHRQALELTDRMIASMGEEKAAALLPLLAEAADAFDAVSQS